MTSLGAGEAPMSMRPHVDVVLSGSLSAGEGGIKIRIKSSQRERAIGEMDLAVLA